MKKGLIATYTFSIDASILRYFIKFYYRKDYDQGERHELVKRWRFVTFEVRGVIYVERKACFLVLNNTVRTKEIEEKDGDSICFPELRALSTKQLMEQIMKLNRNGEQFILEPNAFVESGISKGRH